MKVIASLFLVLLLMVFPSVAQKTHAASITEKDIAKIQVDVKTINDRFEYIVTKECISNPTFKLSHP
jgi:outer membrane lipoprotein-sorting protein